jgi:archaellin
MRKIIVAAAFVVVAAIAAVWSISTLAKPKLAGNIEVTQTSAPISPHELTIKQGNAIPTEYWAHPF